MFKKIRNFLRKDPEFMDLNPGHESLRKVIIWRIIVTILSTGIAYLFLHELTPSLQMVLVEGAIITVVHYLFEEFWESKHGEKNESRSSNRRT